uniref:Uncharacterized protein n=1 Tax=Rhizophora mucronata TaxID=61149 RepID=A0A2P2PAN4_RHIMU
MLRLPGLSAAARFLSMSCLAFLLRISTLTLAVLSNTTYDFWGFFFFFFSPLNFDLMESTRFSNWFAIIVTRNPDQSQSQATWFFRISSGIN